MGFTDDEVDRLARRLAEWLERDPETATGEITPAGEVVFHLGNVLVTVNEAGNFIAVEPGDGFDYVMEMDFEGDVKWSGKVPRSDPSAN